VAEAEVVVTAVEGGAEAILGVAAEEAMSEVAELLTLAAVERRT
jgi:hypothetical protein